VTIALRMEDETMKLGLLMEAAQAQQALAATALDRLREHAAGLDAVVREEIRHVLIEEMQALTDDAHHAAEALRGLRHAANLRLLLWMTVIVSLATTVPFGVAWYLLPTGADVAALGVKRDELTASIARLTRQGGNVELRRCGSTQRLCVRIDRGAPVYGERGDFLVVKGY
jgi:hypothetical protein